MNKGKVPSEFLSDLEMQKSIALEIAKEMYFDDYEINEIQNNFNKQIDMDREANKSQEMCASKLLKILGKEECEVTRSRIIEEFGGQNIQGMIMFPRLLMLANDSMESLKLNYLRKTKSIPIPKNAEEFYKKLDKLVKALDVVAKVGFDKDIQSLLRFMKDDHYDDLSEIEIVHNSFFRKSLFLSECLGLFSNDKIKNSGRPSLSKFYDFVYVLAKLYEELSGNNFSIYRHSIIKSNKENVHREYEPITPGHQFVWEAVQWMHEVTQVGAELGMKYTDKNVYVACENARKRISTTPQNPDK